MNLATLLEKSQSIDRHEREQAESALRQCETDNYAFFVHGLCAVFNATTHSVHVQRLAALVLKNTLHSKDPEIKATRETKWRQLPNETRKDVHQALLKGLHHTEEDVCSTVALAIPRVAAVDLPNGAWTELIPSLLANMEAVPPRQSVQRATLESLGYLCEALSELRDYALPSHDVDRILTAIVRGMTSDASNAAIRLAATQALINALDFAERIFGNDRERSLVIAAICQSVICAASEEVREVGFECMARVVQIYYSLMMPYMAEIYKLTMEAIQRDAEDVVKQAMEVWSTVCEEELDIMKEIKTRGPQPHQVLHGFTRQACSTLVPVLLDQLTRQDEDQELDEDTWSVAMAAGCCLSLVAECVGSQIVPIVMPYVQANIKRNEGPDDWRYREAATFAFGAILEGPEEKDIAPFAMSGLSFLLGAMKDQDPRVRNSTAWTIGRIFEFVHPESLSPSVSGNESVDSVVQCLLQTLLVRDELHILERVCYAIEKLADWCHGQSSVSLSRHFKSLVEDLLKLAFHPVECPARQRVQIAAFEAIGKLVRTANPDSLDLVVQLIPFLSQKLEESVRVQPAEERQQVAEMQGMICGCLTVIFYRLSASEGHRIPLRQCSFQVLTLLGEVLKANSSESVVMEEVMTTLGVMVASGVSFSNHIHTFVPYLEKGLRDHAEKYAFLSCVGAVSDIFANVGSQMEPHAQSILTILCDALSSVGARRDVKPPVLSLLGDICLAISDRFEKYLHVVKTILRQATEMAVREVPSVDEEDTEYVNALLLGIIEGYTGIVQGLSTSQAGRFLAEECDPLLKFLNHLSRDRTRNPAVTKDAIDLLGDLISRTPRFNPDLTQRGWMERFIQEGLDAPSESVRRAAERTRLVYTRVCQ